LTNTFDPKGFSNGSSLQVSWSKFQIVVHKADQPYLVAEQ